MLTVHRIVLCIVLALASMVAHPPAQVVVTEDARTPVQVAVDLPIRLKLYKLL